MPGANRVRPSLFCGEYTYARQFERRIALHLKLPFQPVRGGRRWYGANKWLVCGLLAAGRSSSLSTSSRAQDAAHPLRLGGRGDYGSCKFEMTLYDAGWVRSLPCDDSPCGPGPISNDPDSSAHVVRAEMLKSVEK